METWAIVALVLGSNIIIALSTFFVTKMQVRHSDKRFEKELEKAREVDYRERRREVRGEPLLKLRDALAIMATKLNMLVIVTQMQHNQSDITEEGENKELQWVVDDWKNYGTSGDFLQTLNLQYDAELLKLVEEIQGDYLLLFEYALDYKHLRAEELKEFRELFQKIKTSIPEVQSLINKRLEEL